MNGITSEQIRAIGEICRALSARIERGGKPGPVVEILLKEFPAPSPLQKKILSEVKVSLRKATAGERPRHIYEDVASVLCDWGDTIEEDEVLQSLKAIAA